MRWFTRHPAEARLNRFADGDLDERDQARVAEHLAGCPRCREEVAIVRRLGEMTRSLPTPIAQDEVLRRVLGANRGRWPWRRGRCATNRHKACRFVRPWRNRRGAAG